MIVKCIDNLDRNIPKSYRGLAPDHVTDDKVASSIGRSYAVYAIKHDKSKNVNWYFVYTDNGYLWWMPEMLYRVEDAQQPKGWLRHDNGARNDLIAYPSLNNWQIEEGIIDGESEALRTFLAEVQADSTFPSQEKIDALNVDFDRQQRVAKYEKDLAIAKENGWEWPEKPE